MATWRDRLEGEAHEALVRTLARFDGRRGAAIAAAAGGALAIGALAIGAVAVGALAIGSLTARRARVEHLAIGTLEVGRIARVGAGSRPKRR